MGEKEGGGKSERGKWGTFTTFKHSKESMNKGSRLVKDYTFPKLWIRTNSSWPMAECWVVVSNSSEFI